MRIRISIVKLAHRFNNHGYRTYLQERRVNFIVSVDILIGLRQETENRMVTFLYTPLLDLSLDSFLDLSIYWLSPAMWT
jgi:hypothetical protein